MFVRTAYFSRSWNCVIVQIDFGCESPWLDWHVAPTAHTHPQRPRLWEGLWVRHLIWMWCVREWVKACRVNITERGEWGKGSCVPGSHRHVIRLLDAIISLTIDPLLLNCFIYRKWEKMSRGNEKNESFLIAKNVRSDKLICNENFSRVMLYLSEKLLWLRRDIIVYMSNCDFL